MTEEKETKAPAEKATAEEKKEQVAKKKINHLTLKELEKKIAEVQEKMGNLSSVYAQQLLKRKEQLELKGDNPENA